MERFYFTFGSGEQFPFQGGWIEVWAQDISTAALAFKKIYPNEENDSILNCADYYTEKQFQKTDMFMGNRGKKCQAILIVRDEDMLSILVNK